MKLRASNIERLKHEKQVDVLIVGGGINGAVSAAALSGKGASVVLIDKGDFASSTSQESSNLAWGGIKYLETLELFLVRKLCKSRNHLINNYPSTVKEIRFLTTIQKGFRFHPLFIWLGCWLYWMIGNFFTKKPKYLTRKKINFYEKNINVKKAWGGFEYSDAYLHDNDARFVFNFIRSAFNNGCIGVNYFKADQCTKNEDRWVTETTDQLTGKKLTIKSKVVINAGGPYVDTLNNLNKIKTNHKHVFSKGIHIIVNRISDNHRVLAFFASDGRLFFVIPMGSKTCIGTTDTPVTEPKVSVTEEDRDFILNNINTLLDLDKPLTRADIISERCGVRPLVVKANSTTNADWMKLSRKHEVSVDSKNKYISIYGGKLTDCLNVGNETCVAVEKLGVKLPYPDYKWYGEPGEEMRNKYYHQAKLMNLDSYTDNKSSEQLSTRLWRRYGMAAFTLLENIREDPSQAEVLIEGTEYIRCEVRQASRREMVTRLEDFLRRRSKIALIETKETIKNSKGIREACKMLFGDQADQKFDEYFKD